MSHELELNKGILEKIMLKNTTIKTAGTRNKDVAYNNFSRVETPDVLVEEEELENDTDDDDESVEDELDDDLGMIETEQEELCSPIVQVINIQNIATPVVSSKSNPKIKSSSSSASSHSSNDKDEPEG